MDKQVLLRQLWALEQDITKKVSHINWGGCVHFAYFLSKRLRELGIDHKIGYLHWDKIDMRYKNMSSINHVTVYIDGIGFIDGEEILKHPYTTYKKIERTSLKKLDYYRKNCQWNPDYDKRQNMLVKNLIYKHIK